MVTQIRRLDSYIKLLDFGARWYDPYITQFIQPDSIIPDPANPLDWNRYAYVRNNPLKYTDPSGHMQACADGDEGGGCGYGTPDYRDLTRWIIDAAEYTANDPVIQLVKYLNSGAPRGSAEWLYKMTKVMVGLKLFQDRVKDGARFDFKDGILRTLKGPVIKIGRYWYDYSTPGNILYGYYGAAAGYPAWVLHAGAGKAQWDDDQRDRAREAKGEPRESDTYGFWWCGFDTCDDYVAVQVGYNLYQSGEALTVDNLVTATERVNSLLAHQPAPGPYIPLKHGMYTPEDFTNE